MKNFPSQNLTIWAKSLNFHCKKAVFENLLVRLQVFWAKILCLTESPDLGLLENAIKHLGIISYSYCQEWPTVYMIFQLRNLNIPNNLTNCHFSRGGRWTPELADARIWTCPESGHRRRLGRRGWRRRILGQCLSYIAGWILPSKIVPIRNLTWINILSSWFHAVFSCSRPHHQLRRHPKAPQERKAARERSLRRAPPATLLPPTSSRGTTRTWSKRQSTRSWSQLIWRNLLSKAEK